jgi:predicted transcriptional regulator
MKKYLFLFCVSLFCTQSVVSYDELEDKRGLQLVKQLDRKEEIKELVIQHLQSSEGKRLMQKAIGSGILEDEVKYAVVRYLHTDEGKALLEKLSEKQADSNDYLARFLQKDMLKLFAIGGLAAWLMKDGTIKNVILCAVAFAVFQKI